MHYMKGDRVLWHYRTDRLGYPTRWSPDLVLGQWLAPTTLTCTLWADA